MYVEELMSTKVRSCGPEDHLHEAASRMVQFDCGILPVVDEERRVIGVVTDRDICVAAYHQRRLLWQTPVSAAMSTRVHAVRPDDPLEAALALMSAAQIRRVPVVDGGWRLRGILTVTDLARATCRGGPFEGADGYALLAQTLAGICHRRAERAERAPEGILLATA